MSQNPDFEETSLFDLFPAEEKKTDKKEQKNEKRKDAASKDGRGKESAVTAVKTIKLETAPRKEKYRFRSRKTVPFQQHPHGRKNSGSMILQNRHNGSVTI